MLTRTHLAAPVKLLAWFVLLSGIPLGALAWLSWRLLDQDRALEKQRQREELERSAAHFVADLDHSLSRWEDLLPLAAQTKSVEVPAGSLFLLLGPHGLLEHRGARLPYYPQVAPAPEPNLAAFDQPEADEFQRNDLERASSAYRTLATSADFRLRAEALMRLARVLRKQGDTTRALAVYGELAALGETRVAGSPAELLARHERAVLLTAKNAEASQHETALLAAALSEGRYLIDRTTFEYFNETASPPNEITAAVEQLWPVWSQTPQGRESSGRFASTWRRVPQGTAVMIGEIDSLLPSTAGDLAQLVIEDRQGQVIWGSAAKTTLSVVRTFRETGLPWTVRAVPGNASGASPPQARRNLFIAGFGLMALVVAGAGYFVFRAVSKELRVARLQSDFVAAVSHEFRTPLTAMRHLTETLEEGAASPHRLPQYYRALGKETRRLHSLVENLLDFRRMESGHRSYQMEEANAADLAAEVVQEFRDQAESAAHHLELHTSPERLLVRADRDALAVALRNLLDNAVKYSPESSTVNVTVEPRGEFAGISVSDEGSGIASEERRDIFRKFVRGSSARALNVKGTGIGLTMADQIVRAHGGRLELKSEPRQGATFTILLPKHP